MNAQFDRETVDRLLTTTRSVRHRLDLTRPVARETVVECIRLATYAPNASNAQEWRWLVIDDAEAKSAVAVEYRAALTETMEALLAQRLRDGDAAMVRHSRAVLHLARNLERIPVLVIPCIAGRIEDDPGIGHVTRIFGSIYPAVWSFQLALRSRGLGSTFTTAHLLGEERVAELLGVPPGYTQACLIPVAHTTGGDFRPPPRGPVEAVIGWNHW